MPPQGFKLGIVVLAYHRPEQLATLVQTLRHPQVTIYLHIDSGADIEPFQTALDSIGRADVVWLRRHRSRWGSLGIVDAEIEGIARAASDRCSYVMVISGEDFPLRPVPEIVRFAQENRERSFVETYELPYPAWPLEGRERTDFYTCAIGGSLYTCIPRGEDTSTLSPARKALNLALRVRFSLKPPRRFPSYVRPFGGQQWLNLTPAAAAHVLGFVAEHPDYRGYHTYTACPDEMFIQSILLGTGFSEEHEIVSDDLRFLIWAGGDHPKTLRLDDLPAIRKSSDLFARKVVADDDPQLFAVLRSAAIGVGPGELDPEPDSDELLAQPEARTRADQPRQLDDEGDARGQRDEQPEDERHPAGRDSGRGNADREAHERERQRSRIGRRA